MAQFIIIDFVLIDIFTAERESSPAKQKPDSSSNRGLYGSVDALFFTNELQILRRSSGTTSNHHRGPMRKSVAAETKNLEMNRGASPSTSANTETTVDTPPSAASEHELLDAQLRNEMGPPPNLRTENPISTGEWAEPRPSRSRTSDDLPRPSSAPHERLGLLNDGMNNEPWNPLRGSQPQPVTGPWGDYREPKRPRSESERTARTRAGTARSVISMDTRDDGNREDEPTQPDRQPLV